MVSRLRNTYFLAAVVMIFVTVYLSFGTYVGWVQLGFFVGQFRLNHWLGWIGVVFVAIYTPLYHFLKCRYAKRAKILLDIHVIGARALVITGFTQRFKVATNLGRKWSLFHWTTSNRRIFR